MSPTTVTVRGGHAVGELPTPTRTGYDFDGWYTAASGGTEVTPETIAVGDTMIFYAHWDEIGSWNTYKVLVYAIITLMFVDIAVAILRNYVGGDRF